MGAAKRPPAAGSSAAPPARAGSTQTVRVLAAVVAVSYLLPGLCSLPLNSPDGLASHLLPLVLMVAATLGVLAPLAGVTRVHADRGHPWAALAMLRERHGSAASEPAVVAYLVAVCSLLVSAVLLP